MNENWICPQCGGSVVHFNSDKMVTECIFCGFEVKTEAERQADLDFQRNMAIARQNLRVGNWEEARKLVEPYEKSKPSDKQVYLILLAAVTKGYEDYLLDDPLDYYDAKVYWEKLRRLRCVNAVMQDYARRREALVLERKEKHLTISSVILIICGALTLTAVFVVLSGKWVAVFFIIAAILAWIIGLRWIIIHKPGNFE